MEQYRTTLTPESGDSLDQYFTEIKALQSEVWKMATEKIADPAEAFEWVQQKQIDFVDKLKNASIDDPENCVAYHAFLGSSIYENRDRTQLFTDYSGEFNIREYIETLLKELKDK